MKVYLQTNWFNLKEQSKDWKMFFWFFLYSLIPSIWVLFRTYVITSYMEVNLNTYSYWEYLNIVLEIIQETLIFPLFWFVGKVNVKKDGDLNKAKAIYLFSGLIYSLAIIMISFFVKDILIFLSTKDYEDQIVFFNLQLFSKIFTFLTLISTVYLLNLKLYKTFLSLLIINILVSILFDFSLSNQKVFANPYIGLGLSTLMSQIILFVFSLFFVARAFTFAKFFTFKNFYFKQFHFSKAFFSNLIAAFFYSSINNVFYLLMIAKNLNILNNSDAYWLSNTIIWNWSLLIINSLINIQKSIISTSENIAKEKLKFILGEFQLLSLLSFLICATFFYHFYYSFTSFVNKDNPNLVDRSFFIFQNMIWFFIFYVSTQSFMVYFNALGKNWILTIHALLTNLIANIPFLILFAQKELIVSVNVVTWIFSLTQVIAWLIMILFVYFALIKNAKK